MGVGITNFRPYDLVTRAEFGTVLSRALWGDEHNGADPYYADHLEALNNTVPPIMKDISKPMAQEVRGYVMLMMMRAGEGDIAEGEGCSAEELLACITSDDYDDCIVACSDEDEDDDDDVLAVACTAQEMLKCAEPGVDYEACMAACEDEDVSVEIDPLEKEGDLSVSLSNLTPNDSNRIPVGIKNVPLLAFEVEADGADIALYNAVFEFDGYGNYNNIDEITMYNENFEEVSKYAKDLKDTETSISFVKDLVIKDGGSEVFFVKGLLT